MNRSGNKKIEDRNITQAKINVNGDAPETRAQALKKHVTDFAKKTSLTKIMTYKTSNATGLEFTLTVLYANIRHNRKTKWV